MMRLNASLATSKGGIMCCRDTMSDTCQSDGALDCAGCAEYGPCLNSVDPKCISQAALDCLSCEDYALHSPCAPGWDPGCFTTEWHNAENAAYFGSDGTIKILNKTEYDGGRNCERCDICDNYEEAVRIPWVYNEYPYFHPIFLFAGAGSCKTGCGGECSLVGDWIIGDYGMQPNINFTNPGENWLDLFNCSDLEIGSTSELNFTCTEHPQHSGEGPNPNETYPDIQVFDVNSMEGVCFDTTFTDDCDWAENRTCSDKVAGECLDMGMYDAPKCPNAIHCGPAPCDMNTNSKCVHIEIFGSSSACVPAEGSGDYQAYVVADDVCNMDGSGRSYYQLGCNNPSAQTVSGVIGCTDSACTMGCTEIGNMTDGTCYDNNEYPWLNDLTIAALANVTGVCGAPTSEPTSDPTTPSPTTPSPTTDYPTVDPTVDPTEDPTVSPIPDVDTLDPTVDPTEDPTVSRTSDEPTTNATTTETPTTTELTLQGCGDNLGCNTSAAGVTCDVEFVEGVVYGCGATFGDSFDDIADDGDICGEGYHMCGNDIGEDPDKLSKIWGLTEDVCTSGIAANYFYAASFNSGDGVNCNDEGGDNVFGCGNVDATSWLNSTSGCGPAAAVLSNASFGEAGAYGWTTECSSEWDCQYNEYRNTRHSGDVGGGIMCCRDTTQGTCMSEGAMDCASCAEYGTCLNSVDPKCITQAALDCLECEDYAICSPCAPGWDIGCMTTEWHQGEDAAIFNSTGGVEILNQTNYDGGRNCELCDQCDSVNEAIPIPFLANERAYYHPVFQVVVAGSCKSECEPFIECEATEWMVGDYGMQPAINFTNPADDWRDIFNCSETLDFYNCSADEIWHAGDGPNPNETYPDINVLNVNVSGDDEGVCFDTTFTSDCDWNENRVCSDKVRGICGIEENACPNAIHCGPAPCNMATEPYCIHIEIFGEDSECGPMEGAGDYQAYVVADGVCNMDGSGRSYYQLGCNNTETQEVSGVIGCTNSACSMGCTDIGSMTDGTCYDNSEYPWLNELTIAGLMNATSVCTPVEPDELDVCAIDGFSDVAVEDISGDSTACNFCFIHDTEPPRDEERDCLRVGDEDNDLTTLEAACFLHFCELADECDDIAFVSLKADALAGNLDGDSCSCDSFECVTPPTTTEEVETDAAWRTMGARIVLGVV